MNENAIWNYLYRYSSKKHFQARGQKAEGGKRKKEEEKIPTIEALLGL